MAKQLDVTFTPQSQIQVEHLSQKSKGVPVGSREPRFNLPDLPDLTETKLDGDHPQALQMVTRINRFIENIADDYFLLGLHLIVLHKMLKGSQMTTAQIKAWYLDKINMPYSSAMQCKKVAEVYEDSPNLIERYGASGAYLLTTLNSHEEREKVWIQACGEKATASIASLRQELKHWHQKQILPCSEQAPILDKKDRQIWRELKDLLSELKMLKELSLEEQTEQRQKYAKILRSLATQLESNQS